ncbi:galactosyl transferase GMA12/MNN10 family protein [Sarocladium implicatum]|nr:galactosyl transferase GMA12/MNN10 family protein [Sarocladium implicatum]
MLSHEAHNRIHGYPQFTAPFEAVDELSHMHKKRPSGAWTKPAYLLSVIVTELEKPMNERLEWVYWFDADTVILNPTTKLEVFLPPNHDGDLDDLHLLISSNWDGINSGVFALRVHPWTVSLLSAILAYPIYEKDRAEKDPFRDQSAFHWLLEEDDSPLAATPTKGKEHWTYVPMRWFNSLPFNNAFDKHDGTWLVGQKMGKDLFDNGTTEVYDDGHGGKIQPWKVMQGDMVVHFAGSSHAGTRDSWMRPWLERAEAVLPQWANDTTQDVLAVETKQFWKAEAKRVRELKKDV